MNIFESNIFDLYRKLNIPFYISDRFLLLTTVLVQFASTFFVIIEYYIVLITLSLFLIFSIKYRSKDWPLYTLLKTLFAFLSRKYKNILHK